MKHPAESELALYAGGELSWIERWRASRHLNKCPVCAAQMKSYRRARKGARELANEMPAGTDWNRLAAEMTANIRLGVEAGECVGPVIDRSPKTAWTWKPAAVLAGAAFMLLTAWWLNIPSRRQAAIQPAGGSIVLQSTPAGIELKDSGGALTLMHTRGGSNVMYSSAPNSLRVRYVDSETGQVTINNVYAQ